MENVTFRELLEELWQLFDDAGAFYKKHNASRVEQEARQINNGRVHDLVVELGRKYGELKKP